MGRTIGNVVVLGANGAMGAGSGAVFAAAGLPTTLLARSRERAEAGAARAEAAVKSTALRALLEVGSYDEDFERAVAKADLIFEAVGEDLTLKRELFARVDRVRTPGSIVATVSSGLSIAAMCEGRSDDFRAHFLGMHFFNPPTVITGMELVPHAGTEPAVTSAVREFLTGRCGRTLIETTDTPAFAGNRVGFRVLGEVAQLAQEHGPVKLDALLGTHTGRAMAPLATIDFVGWDVHKAIVDNLYANTQDEAHAAFALPAYMQRLIDEGHLGAKTPAQGGFFRTEGKGKEARVLAPDPGTGCQTYRPVAELAYELPPFLREMKLALRLGRYARAWDLFCEAPGADAELMRKVILGYISYGLGRVGEVVRQVRDIDLIMGWGFNWAPPGLLVDLIGPSRMLRLLEAKALPVPRAIVDAAERGRPLFSEPGVDRGRFLFA